MFEFGVFVRGHPQQRDGGFHGARRVPDLGLARLHSLQLAGEHLGATVLFEPCAMHLQGRKGCLSGFLPGLGGGQPALPFPPRRFAFQRA